MRNYQYDIGICQKKTIMKSQKGLSAAPTMLELKILQPLLPYKEMTH